MSVFDRSGLASVTDLGSTEWLTMFKSLEAIQNEFLANESSFRSPNYIWPRDPLHNWSRVWEYPYAYHHLQTWRTAWRGQNVPTVLDFGSGVTFFPFAVARLGVNMVCADTDPVCDMDLRRAIALVPAQPGSVSSCLINDKALPFADEQFDAVYCISVLEHIEDFGSTVNEIARVLRPNGLFVLTVDIDLQGNVQLGPAQHRELLTRLNHWFQYRSPEVTIHPLNVLDSTRGRYGLPVPGLAARATHLFTQRVVKRLIGLPAAPLLEYRLAIHGLSLGRR